jgi:hypothetical protein
MAQQNRNREERLQIMLDGAELALVDDFRFKRRMPSRASAVRELLKRGPSLQSAQNQKILAFWAKRLRDAGSGVRRQAGKSNKYSTI